MATRNRNSSKPVVDITNVVAAPEPLVSAEQLEVENKFLTAAQTGFTVRKNVLAAKEAASHKVSTVTATAKGFLTGLLMRAPKQQEPVKPAEIDPELREMLNGYLNNVKRA